MTQHKGELSQCPTVGFAGVLSLQDPLARGVLIPGMGYHEGPVLKSICGIIV